MEKRQTRELEDFYKKLEQKKTNEKTKETKRNASVASTKNPTTTASTQTPIELKKSSNGNNLKPNTLSNVKKQINSDENLTKLQQRSMQQFEYDVTKKKSGGTSTIACTTSGWATSKHTFNQLTTHGVIQSRAAIYTMPTTSGTTGGYIGTTGGYIGTTSSIDFVNAPNSVVMNASHPPNQMYPQWRPENTGLNWSNGTTVSQWHTNMDVGNGTRMPTGHMSDVNSWQAKGQYNSVATQPQQQTNSGRVDGHRDNSKHVVLPSR